MKRKITLVLATFAIVGTSLKAQTVATFDELTLPSSDTSFLETQTSYDTFVINSGNISVIGKYEDVGGWGLRSGFNYSNRTDDTTYDWTNDWAAITGGGVNGSDNYGIVHLQWKDSESSNALGIKLTNDAAGEYILGTYVTNTTWAYWHMDEFYANNDYLSLVFRGYLNNNQTLDSVVFNLAENGQFINTWEWVDLTALGKVDSVTMQLYTSDDFTPFYVAFDNFTTSDGICPTVSNLTVTNITETEATVNWDNAGGQFTVRYEIVFDRTATLAPLDTSLVNPSMQTTYDATLLLKGTTYYAHVRVVCRDNAISAWDTVSFKTLGISSLNETDNNKKNIIVTPNPAKTTVSFTNTDVATLQIFSIEGRLVEEFANTNTINIASYPNGIYFAKITNKQGESYMAKFIKE